MERYPFQSFGESTCDLFAKQIQVERNWRCIWSDMKSAACYSWFKQINSIRFPLSTPVEGGAGREEDFFFFILLYDPRVGCVARGWNEWKVGRFFILGTWITAILVSQPFRGSVAAQRRRDDGKSRPFFHSPHSAYGQVLRLSQELKYRYLS